MKKVDPHRSRKRSRILSDDDVVITGISGRFPQADNMEELKDVLFNKKDVITDDRWPSDLPDRPVNRMGALKDLSKFDNDFFNVPANSAAFLDPLQRILLEVTYETITDAGYSVKELEGRHIGVFVGISDPDSTAIIHCGESISSSKNAPGYMACMVSNRISHKFDFLGASFTVDSACSSSGTCFDNAVRRIRDGSIEAAIVGGANLVLDPRSSKSYKETGILSPAGRSRVFDVDCDGFVRSDSVVAIFLQRRKDARRIYATIVNVECFSAGHVLEGIIVPSWKAETYLFTKAYGNIGMDPLEISYVEAHGTGTKAGDFTEVNAIEEIFCKDRKTPLLLGGVKSNLGHSEAASGLCSIAKVILAFENGAIPPNVNYEKPNPKCPGLVNGKMKVITEITPFKSSLAAINNFGFGGVNVHIILEHNKIEKPSDESETLDSIPKLVIYSATTEDALLTMFARFEQNEMPREFYSLLHKSAYNSTLVCPYRGYALLHQNAPAMTSIENVHPVKRQLWYIFPGIGCQWTGMGLELMQLDVFRNSILKSAGVLESLGVDLLELLTLDKDCFCEDRLVTPLFVSITATQIALVDLLKSLGLAPDGIIGHSAGELVCAYSDGCSTAEETILSAYYRGMSVENSNLPEGAMAAVGLSWEEAMLKCPEGTYPACNNAKNSVTISGIKTEVEKFVELLKSENVFARFIDTCGYGFHCSTIEGASQELCRSLENVYRKSKRRSERWLSTCFRESEWDSLECRFASAKYFTHNLVTPVRFMEAVAHIPPGSIVIEISPHCIFRSMMKEELGDTVTHMSLMKKGGNNIDFLLSAVGKLYNLGLDPQVENLYPPISLPVPRGTPMISPLIRWDHSVSHYVPGYKELTVGSSHIHIKTSSKDSFLLDHCIDGRPLFPATGYIYLAWKAFSDSLRKPMESLPIVIENFKITRATVLSSRDDKTFEVSLLNLGGEFEIAESGSIVAKGKIYVPNKNMFPVSDLAYGQEKSSIIVTGKDVYDELKIHGYEYGPSFQGLLEVNVEGTLGLVKWNGEWISFLDSLLLFFGLIHENSDFKLPTGALSIKIDPRVHVDFVSRLGQNDLKGVPVKYDKHNRKCRTPGVEICNVLLEPAPRRSVMEVTPTLEEYVFLPYCEDYTLGSKDVESCKEYIRTCCHLARDITRVSNNSMDFHDALQGWSVSNKGADTHKVLKSENKNFVLLKTLRNMREMSRSVQFASRLESLCQNLDDIIGGDVLFEVVMREKTLRSVLDVVIENCFGKMNVIEWYDGGPMLIPVVQDLMKSCQTKANFKLLHTQTMSIDSKHLRENIIVEQATSCDDIPSCYKLSGDLVLTKFLLGTLASLKIYIRKTVSLTKESGFILFFHKKKLMPPETVLHSLSKRGLGVLSESEIENQFVEENLFIVCKKSCFTGVTVYLLRKIQSKEYLSNAQVVDILDDKYDQWIDKLKHFMSCAQERGNSAVLWLVAQDTPFNGIIGMINCLKQEPGGDKIRCVFLDNPKLHFDANNPFFSEMMKKNLLMNVYRNDRWGSFRHSSITEKRPKKLVDMAYIDCTKLGDLSSFKWFESPIKYVLSVDPKQQLYHVFYSSLNFRDVMLATGKLAVGALSECGVKRDGCILGMEFSGRDNHGRRVMAMVPQGALSNTVLTKSVSVYDVPEHWSLKEAATVPVVYTTCYFALIIRGRLSMGEKVLIHSGAGGIGQAAIRICLSLNCEVFTTVGTLEKRAFLLETFPQLKPQNIGCSRDTTFEEMVMTQTEGKGVDVVLNSLADDKFQASVRCLAKHGRFLEIGKYDLSLDHSLGLRVFLKDVDFQGVMLDSWFSNGSRELRFHEEVRQLMIDGIERGVVQPLNATVFPVEEVEMAFRFMGSGKHMGKVLLKVREEEEPSKAIITPSPMSIKAKAQLHLYPNKIFIIIGGLGGFGIELTKWLIQKGAKTIVLTTRFGARTPYQRLCLRRWEESGARVIVSTLNVAVPEEAKQLLEEVASKCGPVGGIFNSAAVLRDAFFENQNASSFEVVCAPKALGTKNLDELTRRMCPELDFFVCFSSISCGKGNAGQTNYGYANSVMEKICEQRKRDGLHGLAIQWGIIGDVGLVHRHMGEDAMIAGVMSQKIKSCLHVLEGFLLQNSSVVSSFVTAEKSKMKKRSDDVLTQLAKIFSLPDIGKMNPYRTFGEMGMDSMAGVEIKQLLETCFHEDLSLQEILELKLSDVQKYVDELERNKQSDVVSSKAMRHIDFNGPSSLLPIQPIVALNSCKQGTPVFVVNDNDLLFEKFKKLWVLISCPAFALQSTKDTPFASLKDMATWYLQQIQGICSSTPVHLVSLSTASNLALEMTLQSENQKVPQPHIKSLTFLNGSLELMDIHVTGEQEKRKKAAAYEATDLCRFFEEFSNYDYTRLKEELILLPNLESRLNMITNLTSSVNKQEVLSAAEFFLKKQNTIRLHVPSGKITKGLTVLEFSEKVLSNDVSPLKSFLSKLCKGQVVIHRLTGNEKLSFENSIVAEIADLINEISLS